MLAAQEQRPQLGGVAQPLGPRLVHRRDRHVDRARDVPEPPDVALVAVELGRAARIDQEHVRRAEEAAHVGGRQPLAHLAPAA